MMAYTEMKLYEIDERLNNIFKLETGEGVDKETGEVLDAETLHGLEIAKDEKVENILCYIKNLKATAAAYKAEEESFNQRRKHAENKAAQLIDYLKKYADGYKITTAKASLSWRKSAGKVAFTGSEDDVPDSYKVIIKKTDKKAILSDLKAGKEVPGATLIKDSYPVIK